MSYADRIKGKLQLKAKNEKEMITHKYGKLPKKDGGKKKSPGGQ
jgi:hypothetical protein